MKNAMGLRLLARMTAPLALAPPVPALQALITRVMLGHLFQLGLAKK
jgi:hypothetical protein